MATLKEALTYASQNPDSDFAKQLTQHVKSGQADAEAKSLGIDLTPIKQYNPIATSTAAAQQPVQPQGDTGIKGFATGVFKGTANIAKNILGTAQSAGQRVLAAITPNKDYEQIRKETGFDVLKPETTTGQKVTDVLTPKTTSEKIGAFVPEVASLAIPATKISTATKALSFLPRTALRVAGDVGVSQVTSGGTDNAVGTAATSAIVESASPVVKLLGRVLKGTAGALAGTGTDVIEQTLKSPRQVKTALKVPPIESLKSDVSNVLGQTRNLIKQSSDNYAQALDELPKRLGKSPEVLTAGQKTTIRAGGKTYTLSMQGVKSNLTNTLRQYGVEVNPKSKTLNFLQTTLDGGEEKRLKEIFNVVNSWKDTTPKGLNTLATKIKNYQKADTQSKQLNAIIGNVSSNVRDYIGKRVPLVKTMNERFGKEQDFIQQLDTYLSTDIGFDNPQAIKNVAQKVQTLFNKNKELAREVVDNLAGGSQILSNQAARDLSGEIGRSTATIGDKVGALVQSVISPKTIGNIVANTGIALERIKPLTDLLQRYSPQERALLIQSLNSITE